MFALHSREGSRAGGAGGGVAVALYLTGQLWLSPQQGGAALGPVRLSSKPSVTASQQGPAQLPPPAREEGIKQEHPPRAAASPSEALYPEHAPGAWGARHRSGRCTRPPRGGDRGTAVSLCLGTAATPGDSRALPHSLERSSPLPPEPRPCAAALSLCTSEHTQGEGKQVLLPEERSIS